MMGIRATFQDGSAGFPRKVVLKSLRKSLKKSMEIRIAIVKRLFLTEQYHLKIHGVK
jgi:hypothetical protein